MSEDREWGQAVIAFVVADGSAPLDREELLAHARERLERHEVPKRIEPVEDLPRTASGKLLRRSSPRLTSVQRALKKCGQPGRGGSSVYEEGGS